MALFNFSQRTKDTDTRFDREYLKARNETPEDKMEEGLWAAVGISGFFILCFWAPSLIQWLGRMW